MGSRGVACRNPGADIENISQLLITGIMSSLWLSFLVLSRVVLTEPVAAMRTSCLTLALCPDPCIRYLVGVRRYEIGSKPSVLGQETTEET